MLELTRTPRIWRAVMATVAVTTLLLAAVAPAQASDEAPAGFESAWPASESCMSLASWPTAVTDQDDYAPGSTVVVSGFGFSAECDYELRVVRPDGVVETFAVESDADGNLIHGYTLPPPPGVIGEYRVDVVGPGDQVVASVAFMDAIAFANTGTAMTTSGGQATLNIPKPTSTAIGDFLLAQVSAGGTDTSQHICAPSGWTSIRRTTQGSDVAIHTFYKFAAAGDNAVSTYQFAVRDAASCTGTNRSKRMSGGIVRYTGVDTTTPVEAHSGNVGPSSNTLTAASVNASAGARVVAFYGLKKNTGLTPLASDGMTERFDIFVNDGSGPASMAADLEKSTAGATGNKRATTGVAEVWAAQLVSLKAAPSGPTQLAFTTPPRSGTVGQCLGPITVQTQNASGAATNATSATQIALGTNGSGAFYGDEDCNSSSSAADVAAGANSATFYYEATTRGTGSHVLTASAAGLTSAIQSQTIAKLDQTIAFEAPRDRTYGEPDFDPEATAGSGLPVSYSSSTAGVCTITADKIRIVGAGTCTVTASQAGDDDYSAADAVTQSFSVAPRRLTGSFAAEDKVYDATTAARVKANPAPALDGVVEGDDVSLDGDAAVAGFADKHVGEDKTVSATGFVLAGADAGNYTLAMQTATADITPKGLTGSFGAENKIYDGTAAAAIKPVPAPALDGVVDGDDVFLDGTGASASFADKHAGEDKPVTATGFALAGADAGNYTLAMNTSAADIIPGSLTGSFTADDKVYDATTEATISGRSLAGAVAGDDVQLSGGTATFDDRHVGHDKVVTATGLVLAGADKDNYTLAPGPWTANADITPRSVTGSFTAADKVLDGTVDATITGRSLTGTIAADSVELSGGTATFADAGVGPDKTVTGTGFALSGDDKDNYELASSTLTTKASIVYATGPCLGAAGRTILQPIDAAGTSVFKAGATVPTKFRVCDANGNSIGTAGVVTDFRQIAVRAGTVEIEVNEEAVSTTPNTAFRWSEIDRQWIFNLSTKGLNSGKTYTYRIYLADGTNIDFKFGLK
jgi:hypothetical protein